jgi:hypothetical protein
MFDGGGLFHRVGAQDVFPHSPPILRSGRLLPFWLCGLELRLGSRRSVGTAAEWLRVVRSFDSIAISSYRDSLACVLSTSSWEPSFHLGLGRPLLLLVLRRGIAYSWCLQAVRRRRGERWMLTFVSTQCVDCEPSSRLHVGMIAFSSILRIGPWLSLRVSLQSDWLVRGRIPFRLSTSEARWPQSFAPSSALQDWASCHHR